jgi:hypothetical protein
MSKLRIEYVRPQRLGNGYNMDPDAIMDVVAAGEEIVVGAVSAQSAAAPDFPEDRGLKGGVFARLSCPSGAVIVTEAAANPTATSAGGVRLTPGRAVLQPVETGQKFAAIDAAEGDVTYVASAAPGSAAAAILNGASLSGVIDLGEQRLHRVAMGAGWTPASMTFLASSDGTAFNDLYNESGEYALGSGVVAAGRSIVVDQALFYGIRYLKLRSGPAAAAVNQLADRTINLVTVPR